MVPKILSEVRVTAVAMGVGIVALIAGVAIAGLPSSVPNDIVISDINRTPTSTIEAGSPPALPATESSGDTSSDVDGIRNGRSPADTPSPTTQEPGAAVGSPATPPGAVANADLASEQQVRVVVANAGGRDGLAARYAKVVRGFGYSIVETANTDSQRDQSVVYWSPGREDEARRLAVQLAVDVVEPMPDERFVNGSFVADVWAVIGRDLADR